MKKLALILITTLAIAGCGRSHLVGPVIVESIQFNYDTEYSQKFRVVFLSPIGEGVTVLYTNTKYSVGDTLK